MSKATEDTPQTTDVVRILVDIAREQNADVSFISWSGFNLAGDRKSVGEVERLISCESRLLDLEQRITAAGVKL